MLLLEYLLPVAGVYKITCLKNGKVYIGQSSSIHRRWHNHVEELLKNKHSNKAFQADFIKYGASQFNAEIIITGEYSTKELLVLERQYVEKAFLEGKELYNNEFIFLRR